MRRKTRNIKEKRREEKKRKRSELGVETRGGGCMEDAEADM